MWPLLLVVAVLCVTGLWLLNIHAPGPWPESATPWWWHVRARAVPALAVDWLNVAWAPVGETPAGSALVLVALAVASAAAALTMGVPAHLACATGLGLVAMRSTASTAAPGRDAMPVLLVALVVMLVARARPGDWRLAALALVSVVVEPAIAFAVLPAVAVACTGGRGLRVALTLSLAIAALVAHVLALRHAWSAIACVQGVPLWHIARDVLLPGTSADVSVTLPVRQWFAVVAGDVHLFGIGVAVVGLTGAHAAARGGVRRATLATVFSVAVAAAVGLLPPAFGASLLLPWWAPWSGAGFARLASGAGRRMRLPGMLLALALAALLPVARHATYVPGPLVTGTPHAWQAAADGLRSHLLVSDDPAQGRQLAARGVRLIAGDVPTLASCLAAGVRVHAVGSAVDRAELLGFLVRDAPLRVPLAALLRDVRPTRLVALALAPSMLAWSDAADRQAFDRLGVRRQEVRASDALALVAVTGDERRGGGSRDRADVQARPGDMVGPYQLRWPISVAAGRLGSTVMEPPRELVVGRHGAFVLYDRAQDAVLRGVVDAAPGLPVPMLTLESWRHAEIAGPARCVPMTATWQSLPFEATSVSLPLGDASPRQPLVLYLAADAPPRPVVRGLAQPLSRPTWQIAVFDRREPTQEAVLAARLVEDHLPAAALRAARWVARVDVQPRDPLTRGRVTVSAGTRPRAMLVRPAGHGPPRARSGDVCAIVAPGGVLLPARELRVDDEAARALPVVVAEGWHEAERAAGHPYRWSADPTARAAFVLDAPRAVVVEMDVTGAAPAGGAPQPVAVHINDVLVRADWQGTGRVDVPASATREGRNDIVLQVPSMVHAPGDPRALGVLVRQLRVIVPE